MADLAALNILVATTGVTKATAEVGALGAASVGTSAGATALGKATKTAAKDVAKIVAPVEAAAKGTKKLGENSKKAAPPVAQVGRASKKAAAGTKQLGASSRGAAAGVGKLIAAYAGFSVVTKATGAISGFESTMAQVKGIVGATAAANADLSGTFAALEKSARDAGATTRFSADEAAQAQLFLARAGFKSNDILSELNATLNLASAGVLELGEAADIASNVFSTFSKEGLNLTEIADILVATANRANTNVQQLGQGFVYVGATAAALGHTLADTAAFLGVLGNSGIQASLAGTTLNALLVSLLKPTTEAKKVFRQLTEQMGLSSDAFDVSKHSITEVLQPLADAQLGVQQLAKVMGRSQATRAALIGIGNLQAIKDLGAAVKAAKGESEALAKINEDTLAGSFRSLSSAVGELFLLTGDRGLLGALRGLSDFGIDVARSLAGIEKAVITNATAVATFIGTIKSLLVYFAALKLLRLAAGFYTLAKGLASAVLGVRALNVAFAANPIGLIALAITGLVLAYDQLSVKTFQLGDTTVTVGDAMGGAWDVMIEGFQAWVKLFELAVVVFPSQWNRLTSYIEKRWSAAAKVLRDTFGDALSAVLKFTKDVVNKSVAIFVGLGASIGVVASRVFKVFKAISEFSFSSPVESFKLIRKDLFKAIDPDAMVKEMGAVWEASWNADFVSIATSIAIGTGKKIREGLGEAFDDTGLEKIGGLFLKGLSDIGDGISARTKTRAAARLKAEQEITDLRNEQAKQTKKVAEAEAELAKSREALVEGTEKHSKASVEAVHSLIDLNNELREAAILTGLDTIAQDRRRISIQASKLATAAFTEGTLAYAEALAEVEINLTKLEDAQAFEIQRKAIEGGRANLEDMISQIEFETSLVGKGNDQRELEVASRQAAAIAAQTQGGELDDLAMKYVGLVKDMQAAELAANRASRSISASFKQAFEEENLNRVGDQLGDAFARATGDILSGIDSIGDALKNLAYSAVSILQEELFLKPFAASIGGLLGGGEGFLGSIFGGASAKGNLFGSGGITALAKGGILDGPTFAQNGNKTFLAGEAGPEIVAPAVRDSQGRMGVRIVDSGPPRVIEDRRQISIRLVLPNVKDSKSFAAGRKQIAESLREVTQGI